MIQLIISILLSLGFNLGHSNTNYTANSDVVNSIRCSNNFESSGGEQELSRYLNNDGSGLNDIVITDDDNPKN